MTVSAAPVPTARGDTIHASAVCLAGRGLLILGPAGAGKTRLALELIAHGAELIADDRVVVTPDPTGQPILRPPPAIAGLVEIRGAGILRHPYCSAAPLWLAIDLGATPAERMARVQHRRMAGAEIPCLAGGAPLHAAAILAMLRTGNLPEPDFFADRDAASALRRHG